MTAKYIYFEQGDPVPERTVILVFRFASMDNGTVRIQCQGADDLNAWATILSLYEDGKIIVAKDLPHGLFQEDLP